VNEILAVVREANRLATEGGTDAERSEYAAHKRDLAAIDAEDIEQD
jgi:hypothetical protein